MQQPANGLQEARLQQTTAPAAVATSKGLVKIAKMKTGGWRTNVTARGSVQFLWISLLMVLWCCCNVGCAEATITIMESGKHYTSRSDNVLGRPFKSGYEYMARLQYLEGNMFLCPTTSSSQQWNVTVPSDGVPVALYGKKGGCGYETKIRFVSESVGPPGIVRYLIFDGDQSVSRRLQKGDNDESLANHEDPEMILLPDDENIMEVMQEARNRPSDDEDQDFRLVTVSMSDQLEDDDDDDDVADPTEDDVLDGRHYRGSSMNEFGVLHVSYAIGYELYRTLLGEPQQTRLSGGTRILMDGKGSFHWSRTVALWMAISALLSACGCSFLLHLLRLQAGLFDDEPQPSPRRERRRLSVDRVYEILPEYHFNGVSLDPVVVPGQGSRDQLLTPSTASPTPVELTSCSICLDEYVVLDKVRCLPCHHAFHSKCIGRWLTERSATCPLCKTDLYENDEDDPELAAVREGSTQTDAANDTNPWWAWWFPSSGGDVPPPTEPATAPAGQNNLAATQVRGTTTTVATQAGEQPEGGTGAVVNANADGTAGNQASSPSWLWRRFFPGRRSSEPAGGAIETSPMENNAMRQPLLQHDPQNAGNPSEEATGEGHDTSQSQNPRV